MSKNGRGHHNSDGGTKGPSANVMLNQRPGEGLGVEGTVREEHSRGGKSSPEAGRAFLRQEEHMQKQGGGNERGSFGVRQWSRRRGLGQSQRGSQGRV